MMQILDHQKILNLLNEASDCKCMARKWKIVNDQSNVNYDGGNELMQNAEDLKSNPCDYNDAYILVKCNIVTTAHNNPIPLALKFVLHSLNVSQKLMEQQ